jgi:hypothetical protein
MLTPTMPTNATVAGALGRYVFRIPVRRCLPWAPRAPPRWPSPARRRRPASGQLGWQHRRQATAAFGSCIFAVTSSNFAAGHPLALGQTVTVNPCNVDVNTTGAVANGVATSRSVALLLGAAASAGSSVIISVTAGGALTLNGSNVGTVTLTPVSG